MNPYGQPRPGMPMPGQFYGAPPPGAMMPPMAGRGMPPRGMVPPGMMPPPPALAPGYSAPPSSFPRPGAPLGTPLGTPPPLSHQPLPAPPARPAGTSIPPPVLTVPKAGAPPKPLPAKVPKSTTLVMSQIAPTVDNDFLEALIKACGPGTLKRLKDPDTGAPKLFGFIEFEHAESVIVALRVLHNLTVDGQDLKVKASNPTQEYISWWERTRGAGATESAPEDGEEGEDNDQREMRVMESVMDLISKRGRQKGGSEVDDLIGSVRREESSRGRSREDRLEQEFEADRQRLHRDSRARAAQEEREYKARLKEVERFEENLASQRRKRRRQEEADMKERQKATKQDNEASDSEEEEERWRRKPFRFTTAAAARRAARLKEAQDDESDRMKELEEVAAHMQNGRGAQDGRGALEQISGLDNAADGAFDAAREATKLAVNPNDGIMKAMLAVATSKADELNASGGWAIDPKAEALGVKPEAREAPAKRAPAGIFAAADDAEGAQRRLMPIQYSEEEQRALAGDRGGRGGAGAPDIAEMRKRVIAEVPTTPDGVWSYPLKWDMLRLDSSELRNKVHTKMCKVLEGMLGEDGAVGVANDVWKMLLQRQPPAAVAGFVDFLGESEARDFVFKTFRLLIAESELHALDKLSGLA